jgi:LTXXQ motif family protein
MRVAPLALALVVLVVAADAEAQFGGMGGRRGGMRGGDAGRTQSAERREPIDRLQLVLEELRADLRLSSEQAPRWDAYRQKVEALAGDISRERRRTAPPDKLDAVQQLNRLVDSQRNRLAAMEDIAQVASALYASLTPEQKELADLRLANVVSTLGPEPDNSASGRGAGLPRMQ